MENKHTIVIDTLGSDKGPEAIIEGAKMVLDEFENINVTLVGDEELIKSKNLPSERIKIIHAPETVTNYDSPVEAFYKKANVSVFKAVEECAKDDSAIGIISAGNTGALLVGTLRYLLNEKRTRPALAAILPNMQHGFTCLVDTGASIDCGPSQLVEFAHLGTDFMRKLYKIESPRVGLLSNGSEPTKGNHLVKETYPLLAKEEGINFIGNIEGTQALSGKCDVLVAEGFAGNQVLKNSEGMAINLITEIIKFGKKTGNEEITKQIAGYIMKTYDFESLGAGIMLGARKLVMKCRGSSGPVAIKNTAKILANIIANKTFYE
ncbi:MAG: phosphate acyltransferase [Bacilli bacterium]|nr:phosphate acyltransferase [Bacilli bacterium]